MRLESTKVWLTFVAQAFRKLNGMAAPAFVTVPKSHEKDMEMKAARESSS